MKMLIVMWFWSVLGQTKFEGLTFCLDVNQESVDKLLITRAHKILR